MSRKRFYVRTTALTESAGLDLDDAEAAVIVRILRALADVPDAHRRMELAAMAIKIGVIEADEPTWGPLRMACGLDARKF